MHPDMSLADHFPYGKISKDMEETLWKLALANRGKVYQQDVNSMIKHAWGQDLNCWVKLFGEDCFCVAGCAKDSKYDEEVELENRKEVFCSELVASVLMESGIVRKVVVLRHFQYFERPNNVKFRSCA